MWSKKKTRDGGAISLIKIIVKRVRYKDDEMEWNVRREKTVVKHNVMV